MKKVNASLNEILNSLGMTTTLEKQKNNLLANPEIKEFLQKNDGLVTKEMIDNGLMALYEFSNEQKDCSKCENLGKCVNTFKGYVPELTVKKHSLHLVYHECHNKQMEQEKRKLSQYIQSMYIPKDILEANFDNIELTNDNLEALQQFVAFIQTYGENPNQKGIYLHGEFGVGKSYFLGALANKLAEEKIQTMIVFVPDLFRELKSAIGDNTLNEKIDKIKKVPVLMMDDIGSESMSSWTRDEILGPILQHRMLEKLPTFFTSNFNLEQLEHHLAFSQRGEEEPVKAKRIMERIRTLSVPIQLKGKNRRH